MQAGDIKFLPFIDGKKHFVIPIYQRTYSWTHEQCQQPWDDIVQAATSRQVAGHFIGSIVYVKLGESLIGNIERFMVIDGQQRLTTLSLLLVALANAFEESGAPDMRDDIYESYLTNKVGSEEERYKLLLTQSDKEALKEIIKRTEFVKADGHTNRLIANYHFFAARIRQSVLDLMTIYQGIGKLFLVQIALGKDDNPQLIFESLNSTGMDLSQADLIRNYVLMGLHNDEQTQLYGKYWYPMEQQFRYTDSASHFDRFIRDYLTLKQGTIPNIDRVYVSFKTYQRSRPARLINELVADIYRYAEYFVKMAFAREDDREIKLALQDIHTLKVDVAYPFFLELYDDYIRRRLAKSDFVAILKLVESYVFRRAICGVPTNALNKVFATLGREIDKDHYLESVQAAFLQKEGSARFPRDEEFRNELIVKNVYTFSRRHYLFTKLENEGYKERVNIDEYTIEHIMPQNEHLSIEWQQMLGPDWQMVHETYLHRLGNLTLTGYNSVLSDSPFLEKRDHDGGFANSPLHLNQSLRKYGNGKVPWYAISWNTVGRWLRDFERRDIRPLGVGGEIHPLYAKTTETDTSPQYGELDETNGKSVYTLDSYPYLHGTVRDVFDRLRRHILNLDQTVREVCNKYYVAYKTTANFVSVEPQMKNLRLFLATKFNEINDPKGLCRDVTGLGHMGTGDVEVKLSSYDQLDDVMNLIRQSFEKHWEDEDA